MITSRDNAKLALVRKLAQAKHRRALGLFACVGEDLVDAALAAGIEPVELLVAGENVEPSLLAHASDLPHPPRVVGVFRAGDLPAEPRGVCIALWQLADPGNVGTLIRTADAFGAAVALAAGSADPLGPKALRASAGAIFRVPLIPWDDAPSRHIGLVAHGGEPLDQVGLDGPLTLVVGAERHGLPDDVVRRCDVVASIRLPGDAESLNVAAAGAIALHEVDRYRREREGEASSRTLSEPSASAPAAASAATREAAAPSTRAAVRGREGAPETG